MELLAPTTMDTVQAKEAVFGTPRQGEQSRLAKMRTSSIFSSSSAGYAKRKFVGLASLWLRIILTFKSDLLLAMDLASHQAEDNTWSS
jgi:hypothetical protein